MKCKLTKNRWILLFAALIVAQTAFIWFNSMASKESSGELSSGIMLFLKGLIDPENRIDAEFLHHIVRKTAHFSEFFLLGSLYTLLRSQFSARKKEVCTFLAPFAVLTTAVTDEYIQLFTGRGSRVSDVVLDFVGGLCGILVLSVVLYFWKRRKSADKGSGT